MELIITPQIEIDKYFDSSSLNQSTLKELQYGLDSFLQTIQKREENSGPVKPHFLLGGAIDTILTGECDTFESKYFVSKMDKKPSDTEIVIIERVFNYIINRDGELNIKSLDVHRDVIFHVVDNLNWQPKWKENTRIDKIIEVGSQYFEELKLSIGKEILSTEQYNLINTITNSLINNERTEDFFNRNLIKESNFGSILCYQLPLYFQIKGIECKALLDLVIFRVVNNVLYIYPYDLKTKSGFTIDFPSNTKNYRYDIQSSWYTDALYNGKSTIYNNIISILLNQLGILNFNEIIVKPFTFIVESTTNPGKPLLFEINEDFYKNGKYGKYTEDGRKLTKGYLELLEDYEYYSETGWKEEKIVTENNGVLKIGGNYDIVD